ncbi:MAG: glycoside hydrolase family 99-like domain-containing protein, partial [Clostridia bacterium]|nr:glycoside hydrolase family 99-like domain-containing protein [Clostridia bacterium]
HRLITVMLAAVLGIASIGLAGCEKQTDEDLQNPDTSSETEETAEMIKIYDHSDEVIPPETIRKEDAYQLCYNQNYNGRNGYPVSGWRYDNRGGPLQTEVGGGPGVLNDISEEYGVALIRDFNKITSGRIVTETSIKAMGEGVYLEYQDTNGNPLYRLTLRDDSWKLLNPDGGETVLMDHVFDDKSCTAAFRITLDLDKGTAVTVINHKDLGEYPLLSDSLGSFRFATEDKAKVSAAPGSINIVANYAAYEDFSQFGTQKVYDWETDGTVNINDSALLIRKGTSAKKNFSPIGGRVVAETKFLLKDDGAVDISLQSGNQTVLTFRAKSGMFSAGPEDGAQSEMLYEGRKNMWYRLRITADGNTGEAGIYINGRLAGSVPMATILPVDGVTLSSAEGTASFDMLRVFGEVEHEDYVPAPAVRASFDDYVVGLNICSLWREGHHYGWSCIAPFAEPEPVLGYYDEGTPETADWEIKYMVEHGIDYQAFCWYADVSNGPLKNPRMSEHLHDGFQFAKYSDYMKYTLIWEAANAQHFDSYQFRNHVIPYWFENYFLDDRYLKIDNKIVLQIFGQDKLSDNTYFGSVAGVKAEFDYLRETAKSYGFDGVIIIGCSGRADDNYAAMGIDAVSAYNWGNAGNRYDVNKNSILTSAAASDKVYTIPTVSVGFDSIPWHGVRYGMISLEDYRAANEWVKNEYLPTHTEKGAWNDRLVMMSTWNEYGEGTYIMPCENLHGFGYLDVIRETFTDYGPADETVNLVPTAVQKERINHLFPQNVQHLRSQGWYGFGDSFDTTGHTVVKALEFTKETCSVFQIGHVKYDNGDMSGVSDPGKSDPIINFKKDCDLETADIDAVRITMQADAGTSVVLYFTTDGDGGLSESKTLRFVTDTNEMKSYVVKTGECSTWTGILKHVRLDPTTAADAAFTMRSIEFLT